MTKPPAPLFLERRLYRRRRMMDAARLLPLLGLLLFLVPLLWSPDPSQPAATTSGLMYLFGIWALLIVISAVLSRWLVEPREDSGTKAQTDTEDS